MFFRLEWNENYYPKLGKLQFSCSSKHKEINTIKDLKIQTLFCVYLIILPSIFFVSGFSSAAASGGHHISDPNWHRDARLVGHAPDHRSPRPPILHRSTAPEVAAIHQHSGHRHSSEGPPPEPEPPPGLLRHQLQRRRAGQASPGAAAAAAAATTGGAAAAAAGVAAVGHRQPGSWTSVPDQLSQREPGPGGWRGGVHRHPHQEHQEVCAVAAAAAAAAPAETRQ